MMAWQNEPWRRVGKTPGIPKGGPNNLPFALMVYAQAADAMRPMVRGAYMDVAEIRLRCRRLERAEIKLLNEVYPLVQWAGVTPEPAWLPLLREEAPEVPTDKDVRAKIAAYVAKMLGIEPVTEPLK
jgi:hypothetical protein